MNYGVHNNMSIISETKVTGVGGSAHYIIETWLAKPLSDLRFILNSMTDVMQILLHHNQNFTI